MALYVDNNTSLIYEVKLFEEFALVRPTPPGSIRDLRKIDLGTFDQEFHEYGGNADTLLDYIEMSKKETKQ